MLKVSGDFDTAHTITLDNALTSKGRGFKAVATDYDGLADKVSAEGGQVYYIAEEAENIRIEGADASEVGDMTVSGLNTAEMYYVDGALRIYEANHTVATTPKWRGHIAEKDYGVQGSTSARYIHTSSWEDENAHVDGAFPEITLYDGSTACQNALMILTWPDSSGTASNGFNAGSVGFSFNDQITDTGANTGGSYKTSAGGAQSDMTWGLALSFGESSAGNDAGTWMPTDTSSYKFYVTTMYDNGTQESLPQLMTMYPGSILTTTNQNYIGTAAQSEIYFTNNNF